MFTREGFEVFPLLGSSSGHRIVCKKMMAIHGDSNLSIFIHITVYLTSHLSRCCWSFRIPQRHRQTLGSLYWSLSQDMLSQRLLPPQWMAPTQIMPSVKTNRRLHRANRCLLRRQWVAIRNPAVCGDSRGRLWRGWMNNMAGPPGSHGHGLQVAGLEILADHNWSVS